MTLVKLATTDNEINDCYAVMAQLRPHILQNEFLTKVRSQMAQGYLLAGIATDGAIVACAGFRYGQNLAWGKFLYVDDLITDQHQRSLGHGRVLLDWLFDQARANDCAQLHLDSGLQRQDAHRFYLREGLAKTGYHFAAAL